MSHNAWETTSLTSLRPLTHFSSHTIILYLSPPNDVGDVVSQAFLLARRGDKSGIHLQTISRL